MKNIFLILISVSLNAIAQILMRYGMMGIGKVTFSMDSIFKMIPAALSNIFLWMAFCCYGLSIILWMAALSRVEVSFAYTFSSVGFILVMLLGAFFLKEPISIMRIIGIGIVCMGITVIARG